MHDRWCVGRRDRVEIEHEARCGVQVSRNPTQETQGHHAAAANIARTAEAAVIQNLINSIAHPLLRGS